ncbi:hypothetical protein TIFTF001_019466 [Ficus carica]|uniref:Uncharacterized protein n=1 Tax=Ficus carica TaxID=3494 RepID=A0AA88AD13_FICCA|nr:hypothetical protein TIFTF001_019466 [Ficus carica]
MSDSFGVLLLETVSGRRNANVYNLECHLNLIVLRNYEKKIKWNLSIQPLSITPLDDELQDKSLCVFCACKTMQPTGQPRQMFLP